jgi:hypothetical protein
MEIFRTTDYDGDSINAFACDDELLVEVVNGKGDYEPTQCVVLTRADVEWLVTALRDWLRQ